MTLANRGKAAETAVKKYLAGVEAANATSIRFPDARSGSFQVTPCDFITLRKGQLYMLEVKAVEHPVRLPFKNFSVDQMARMRAWESAGAEAWVLVYFTPLKLWRAETVGYFMNREVGGSWNMEHIEAKPLTEIMQEIFK